MSILILKSNLITINKYFSWYASIISKAIDRPLEPTLYYEKHHIIPESFFIERKRKGPKGIIAGNANEITNIVSLSAREHFICHMLLAKMDLPKILNQKASHSLASFLRSKPYQERNYTAAQYEMAKLTFSKIRKQSTGKYKHPPEVIAKLKLPRNNGASYKHITPPSQKGKIYINNSIKECRIDPNDLPYYESLGFIQGKLKSYCPAHDKWIDNMNFKRHHLSCRSHG